MSRKGDTESLKVACGEMGAVEAACGSIEGCVEKKKTFAVRASDVDERGDKQIGAMAAYEVAGIGGADARANDFRLRLSSEKKVMAMLAEGYRPVPTYR